jgi:dTDP-4-dehydrorhamnose 3,5-epimerase
MIFTETTLHGSYVIHLERNEDQRGFFARSWCRREFESHGLSGRLSQCNISFNRERGTLRGMHFQEPPYAEAKLVRCTRGSAYDVMIDLRRDSVTFRRHFGTIVSAENREMVYVPEGFAHGFLTMEDSTEIFYQMSEFYAPEHARGVRWDDPAFGVRWPVVVRVISDRDRSYPDFTADRLLKP